MTNDMMTTAGRLSLIVLGVVLLLTVCQSMNGASSDSSGPAVLPKLVFSDIPPAHVGGGSDMFRIGGTVTGVKPETCKIVVYAHAGAVWWVQPLADAPLTTIGADGTWRTETHGGNEYAATLVANGFEARATVTDLPPVGGKVLAVSRVEGGAVAVRQHAVASSPQIAGKTADWPTIRFAGYDWLVKTTGDERFGPGPNFFGRESVRVEPGGVRLSIVEKGGSFYCGELIAKRHFGYGTYRFEMASRLDDLDKNVIMGLFTWSDAPEQNHREIDIEFSRWGIIQDKNAQYAIQPYERPGNLSRFALPSGVAHTAHTIKWTPEYVSFWSEVIRADGGKDRIAEHIFTKNLPEPGDESLRINLWLYKGTKPSGGSTEVLISDFTFTPLD